MSKFDRPDFEKGIETEPVLYIGPSVLFDRPDFEKGIETSNTHLSLQS